MKNLKWNVYIHDFNRNKFEVWNIFDNWSFEEYVNKIFKEFKNSEDKESFAKRLNMELMYCFWSKCEYEAVITRKDDRIIMTPLISKKAVELDVTDDKDFDWIGFYDWMKEERYNKDGSIKIDACKQVLYKFEEFVEYCWENRK